MWEEYAIKHFEMCCAESMFSGNHLSSTGMLRITVPLKWATLGVLFCSYSFPFDSFPIVPILLATHDLHPISLKQLDDMYNVKMTY